MGLLSEERQAKRKQKRELTRRRKAIENENFDLAARCGIAARRFKQKAANLHRRRVGTFRTDMLDGHPGNITPAVKRFIAVAYKFADAHGYVCTVTSTTGGGHSPTSYHYEDPGEAVDLIFATVEQMVEFQGFAEGHTSDGAGDWLELFGPAAFYVKNGVHIPGFFPDHGDHIHGAPDRTYRL